MTAGELADLNGYLSAIVAELIDRGDHRPNHTIIDEELLHLGAPPIARLLRGCEMRMRWLQTQGTGWHGHRT